MLVAPSSRELDLGEVPEWIADGVKLAFSRFAPEVTFKAGRHYAESYRLILDRHYWEGEPISLWGRGQLTKSLEPKRGLRPLFTSDLFPPGVKFTIDEATLSPTGDILLVHGREKTKNEVKLPSGKTVANRRPPIVMASGDRSGSYLFLRRPKRNHSTDHNDFDPGLLLRLPEGLATFTQGNVWVVQSPDSSDPNAEREIEFDSGHPLTIRAFDTSKKFLAHVYDAFDFDHDINERTDDILDSWREGRKSFSVTPELFLSEEGAVGEKPKVFLPSSLRGDMITSVEDDGFTFGVREQKKGEEDYHPNWPYWYPNALYIINGLMKGNPKYVRLDSSSLQKDLGTEGNILPLRYMNGELLIAVGKPFFQDFRYIALVNTQGDEIEVKLLPLPPYTTSIMVFGDGLRATQSFSVNDSGTERTERRFRRMGWPKLQNLMNDVDPGGTSKVDPKLVW